MFDSISDDSILHDRKELAEASVHGGWNVFKMHAVTPQNFPWSRYSTPFKSLSALRSKGGLLAESP